MQKMTVGQLIALLEEYPEDYEVRLAFQPSWPLQYNVSDVLVSSDDLEKDDDDQGDAGNPNANVVWIREAGQHYKAPYCPGGVFDKEG